MSQTLKIPEFQIDLCGESCIYRFSSSNSNSSSSSRRSGSCSGGESILRRRRRRAVDNGQNNIYAMLYQQEMLQGQGLMGGMGTGRLIMNSSMSSGAKGVTFHNCLK